MKKKIKIAYDSNLRENLEVCFFPFFAYTFHVTENTYIYNFESHVFIITIFLFY